MELYADRFLLLHDGDDSGELERRGAAGEQGRHRLARDVATGEPVTLIETSAGGPTEQLRWSMRCGRFADVHHGHLAALLDFGVIGEGRRFEAWRGSGVWRGDPAAATHARAMSDAYLSAADLRRLDDPLIVTWNGRPVIVPDARAGDEVGGSASSALGERPWAACGVASLPRAAVSALAEVMHDPDRCTPRAVALCGAEGSGLRVAVRSLARTARLAGIVPVDAALDDSRVWQLVADRSVLVIDRAGDGRGFRRLLGAAGRRGRAHLLLLVSHAEVPRVDTVRLEPIATEALIDAVRPHAWQVAHRMRIADIARRAAGSPGRFAAGLWALAHRPPAIATAAAEQPPQYGGGGAAMVARATRAWPVSGDVAALRRKLSDAVRALQAGRYATSARDIRGTVAALVRRHDPRPAGEALTRLAEVQVRRGRIAEARRSIDEARGLVESTGDAAALGALSLALVAVHLHAGALGDAEAVARSVLVAAEARDDHAQAVAAGAVLARALVWQGRYTPALEVVARLDDGRGGDREAVALAIAAAHASLGQPMGGARAAAARALAAADRLGEPHWRARARLASACVCLCDGDVAGALRESAAAVAAARAAHDPLLALRARLVAAEAHRREGRRGPAARLLRRTARVPRPVMPITVGTCLSVLREIDAGGVPAAIAEHAATTTGLRAVTLFVPKTIGVATAEPRVDELLELFAGQEDAEDDVAALTRTCAAVRRQLRALAVGVVVSDGASARVLALEGSRLDTAVGERAITLGQSVTERPPSAGVESGTPVRYGGRTVGALVARWSAGAGPPADRVAAVLRIAGALAAPAIAAAARPPVPSADDDIVGVSEAIEGVRDAVARAAAVSYPVLIEGESGSGKELVARALHRRGSRRDRPFVPVNCAAVPDDMLEAEFFGHARGAFTGALTERPGVFEEAHGGTLFLDEVGELSLRAQAKLLRTLQEGEVRRVGENMARRVDVRVVAATNRNLRHEAASGRFRLDLMYRLDVVRIVVPPLRERIADVPLLIERCWRDAAQRVQSRAVLSAATVAALAAHDWPGNVRELQNVIASLAVRAPKRGVLPPSALPWAVGGMNGEPQAAVRLDAARRLFEAQFVKAALARAGGHRGRAASALGLTRQGLTKILTRLSIDEERRTDDAAGDGA